MADPIGKPIKIIFEGDASGAQRAGQQAKAAVEGVKDESKNTLNEMQDPAWAHAGEMGKGMEEGAETAKNFAGRSHEIRLVAGELNRILPGLGTAFRGLTAAMGPFIVVALAIEAATTYWKLYKDRVAEAAQAHAEAMDRFRESTRTAVEENSNFAKSMDDAKTAAETLRAALADGQAILEAQLKVKRELAKLEGRPEDAIGDRQAKIELEGNVIAAGEAKLNSLLKERADLTAKQKAAGLSRGAGVDWETGAALGGNLDAINQQATAKDKEIEDLKKTLDAMQTKQRTDINVAAIENAGDAAKDVFGAGKSIADRLAKGGTASPEETEYLQRLTGAISGHSESLAQAVTIMEKGDAGKLMARVLTIVETQGQVFTGLAGRIAVLESQSANQAQHALSAS